MHLSIGVLRFAPPLIIKKEDIDWALERIERVLNATQDVCLKIIQCGIIVVDKIPV